SSAPVRVKRRRATTLPWGWRRSVHADVPTGTSTCCDSWPWRNFMASGPATRTKSRGSSTTPRVSCRSGTGGHLSRGPHAAGGGDGGQQGGRLVVAIVVLGRGVAVGHDARPRLHRRPPVGPHENRPDGDGGVEVAGEVKVADDAGVGAPLGGLEGVDDLHGPHLGRSRDGPRRQGGPQ